MHYIKSIFGILYTLRMKKNIDIDETLLFKLKILSAFEQMSVKSLMEKAIASYVAFKEQERLETLSKEEKEDLGLLALMQQSDRTETVSREEIMNFLED